VSSDDCSVERVEQLLSDGARAAATRSGTSALAVAVRKGRLDVCRALLHAGASPTLGATIRRTALFAACAAGRVDILGELLERCTLIDWSFAELQWAARARSTGSHNEDDDGDEDDDCSAGFHDEDADADAGDDADGAATLNSDELSAFASGSRGACGVDTLTADDAASAASSSGAGVASEHAVGLGSRTGSASSGDDEVCCCRWRCRARRERAAPASLGERRCARRVAGGRRSPAVVVAVAAARVVGCARGLVVARVAVAGWRIVAPARSRAAISRSTVRTCACACVARVCARAFVGLMLAQPCSSTPSGWASTPSSSRTCCGLRARA
jgi:hypothetical protein